MQCAARGPDCASRACSTACIRAALSPCPNLQATHRAGVRPVTGYRAPAGYSGHPAVTSAVSSASRPIGANGGAARVQTRCDHAGGGAGRAPPVEVAQQLVAEERLAAPRQAHKDDDELLAVHPPAAASPLVAPTSWIPGICGRRGASVAPAGALPPHQAAPGRHSDVPAHPLDHQIGNPASRGGMQSRQGRRCGQRSWHRG